MNFSINHFLMRQSLDMDIAVLSGLWMEQVQYIGACYCESCYLRAVHKKFISIQRLKLNVAVVSVKTVCLLKKDLNLWNMKEWIIKNDARKFKEFIANRVWQIIENTDVKQWCNASSWENPADGTSGGLNAVRVDSESYWFQGSPFLWKNGENWFDVLNVDAEVHSDDLELRRKTKSCAPFVSEDIPGYVEQRISIWPRLARILGLVLCKEKTAWLSGGAARIWNVHLKVSWKFLTLMTSH